MIQCMEWYYSNDNIIIMFVCLFVVDIMYWIDNDDTNNNGCTEQKVGIQSKNGKNDLR